MNCTDFERAIQGRLDARQVPLTPDLRPHHDECAACRSFCASQEALLLLAQSWTPPVPPPGLIDAVLADLSLVLPVNRTFAAAASPAWGRIGGIMCSTAAMLVLTVTLLWTPKNAHQPVTRIEPSQPPVETAIVSETLAGLFQGMNAEYTGLSAETSRALQDFSGLSDSAGLLKDLPPTRSPRLERPVDWERWDRPVSDRVGQAFDFLWDALPRTPPQSSS